MQEGSVIMKKIMATILTGMLLLTQLAGIASAERITAYGTGTDVYLNDTNTYTIGYNIYDNNYFKLRDIAASMKNTPARFDVVWNEAQNSIELISGENYTGEKDYGGSYGQREATPTTSQLLIDGKVADITAYNIDDSNYYKLRDLGEYFPFRIVWDEANNRICLYTEDPNTIVTEGAKGNIREMTAYKSTARWSSVMYSNIYSDDGDTLTVVDATDDAVNIDTYASSDYSLISQKSVPIELEKYGGFYAGKDYNYLVFGQDNVEEDDSKPTFRVVKYSKSFDRIAAVDYSNNNTIHPFDAGSLRMDEYKGYLYVRSCHEMYTTSDGNNHQSNITFSVNTDKMEIADEFSDIMNIGYGYVSHSFNQFIKVDDGVLTALDLGDAYPRAVTVGRYDSSLSGGRFTDGSYIFADMFEIPGEIGANSTGVTVGGFEISDTSYLAAINTIEHSKATGYTSFGIMGLDIDERDVVLCVAGKTNPENCKQIKLTEYVYNGKLASTPYLVKMDNDRFMVLWEEFEYSGDYDKNDNGVKYVIVDGNGSTVTEVQSLANVKLSEDCQPIYVNGKVVWYINSLTGRKFFFI